MNPFSKSTQASKKRRRPVRQHKLCLERLEDRSLLTGGLDAPVGYRQLPLSFEPNQGQMPSHLDFAARGPNSAVSLDEGRAMLSLWREIPGARGATRIVGSAIKMQLVGANQHPTAAGIDPLAGVSNYLIGHNPETWHTDIPNYSRVLYDEVYAGIDLTYYGTDDGQLEYDFVIAPGVDPGAITLRFSGIDKLRIDRQGDLVLRTRAGSIRQHKPVIYQEVDGIRREISGGYLIRGPKGAEASKLKVGFKIGRYDHTRPLIIDPLITYSSYLGGSGADVGNDVAVDAAGNAYVTGSAASLNFPTKAGAFQLNNAGGATDVFVTKLDPTGTTALYSTYLGGSNTDRGYGIAVDSAGNAHVTGETRSVNFPSTAGAFQAGKSAAVANAFITKLNPAGNGLLYSTYLGGTTLAEAHAIALDAQGLAYVTGRVDGANFPTSSGAFRTTNAGAQDIFVSKLQLAGAGASDLLYSTYVGGAANENGDAIAVDGAGMIYVSGFTLSADSLATPAANEGLPTTSGAFQPGAGGGGDAFLLKINPSQSGLASLPYLTYLGGSSADNAVHDAGVAVKGGLVYLTGSARTTFPVTAGAYKTTPASSDVFVAKLDLAQVGSAQLVYSTFLGGSATEQGKDIAVDDSGNAYVTGQTSSNNFPATPNAFQSTNAGGTDAFFAKLSANGSQLLYSTYLGGPGNQADVGLGIALDAAGNSYITGQAGSASFPTTAGALQTASGGSTDAFVTQIPASAVSPNSAPHANDDAAATNEDQAVVIPVLTNDTDPDGDPLAIFDVSAPLHGTVVMIGQGLMTYQSEQHYFGTDSFTYTISDGQGHTDTATVALTINAVNDVPVAVNDSYTLPEDNFLSGVAPGVLFNDTDADGDPLSAVLVSSPLHGALINQTDGSLLRADGQFFYAPNANFHGTDSFTYKANDGLADSNVATVTITVNSLNDLPLANPDDYTINEDRMLTVAAPGLLANDSDADGDILTALLVSGPAHGILHLNDDGSFTYTPNSNFNGTDSFTYKTNDGAADSNVVTVSITINAVNNAPVAVNDSYILQEDNMLFAVAPGILANDNDADGDSLRAILVADVSHGELSLADSGSFLYKPDPNFHGTDSFTYRANDGLADSNVATVTIAVVPVDDNFTVSFNAVHGFLEILGTDEADNLELGIDDLGRIQVYSIGPDGNRTPKPIFDVTGQPIDPLGADWPTATSTQKVSVLLGGGGEKVGIIIVNNNVGLGGITDITVDGGAGDDDINLDAVLPPPDPDIPNEPRTLYINIQGGDGRDDVTARMGVQPTPYMPTVFSVMNFDGGADDDSLSVITDVTAVMDVEPTPFVPSLFSQVNVAGGDGKDSIFALTNIMAPRGAQPSPFLPTIFSATNVDAGAGDDSLAVITNITAPMGNQSTPLMPNVVSVMNVDGGPGFDTGDFPPGTTYANVENVHENEFPVANDDTAATFVDSSVVIAVKANDQDADGDPLNVIGVTDPPHGTASIRFDDSITYTPDLGFVGTDTFDYTITDGRGGTDSGTVTVTVAPNPPPVANNDTAATYVDSPVDIAVKANDMDINGDPLNVIGVTQPAHGTASIRFDDSITYTPDPGFLGTDTFDYTITDGHGNTDTAMVIVSVRRQSRLFADFNGDGYGDLAVGVPYADDNGADMGAVHVIYGSVFGLSAATPQVLTHATIGFDFGNRNFGSALAAGDFNADGKDDLAIAAPDVFSTAYYYVVYGTGSGLDPLNVSGFGVGGQGTTAALAAGDFNGDGKDDLAFGAPFANQGMGGAFGAVEVRYGSSSGLSDAESQLWDEYDITSGAAGALGADDHFGESLAAGDFNGDGNDDLAIGVPGEDVESNSESSYLDDAGAVRVLYGSASEGLSAIGNQYWTQNSYGIADTAEPGDRFGTSLAAGDFDGDGKDDLAIGVPFEDIGVVDAGAVHVIYGSANRLTPTGNQVFDVDDWGAPNPGFEDFFGRALAAGDFNGDGTEDLAIGAPYHGIGGAVFLLVGSAVLGDLHSEGDFWTGASFIEGAAQTDDQFGFALTIGDYDNDLLADLAIGIPGEDQGEPNAGAVRVRYGASDWLDTNDTDFWTQVALGIFGDPDDRFGSSL